MYEILELANFGRTDHPNSLQIAAGAGMVALSIDPASEIDACWIQHTGAGYTGSRYLISPAGSLAPNNVIGVEKPVGATAYLSTEHPLVGPVRGTITVLPAYAWNLSAINAAGDVGQAKLILRLWRTTPPDLLSNHKRGVIRAGWSVKSGLGAAKVIIPTFGRKLLRLWTNDNAGGVNVNLDYALAPKQLGITSAASELDPFWGTATAIVSPASPSFANLLTTDCPDWLTVSTGAGVLRADSVVVEAYD
jgi:hypothetical protein